MLDKESTRVHVTECESVCALLLQRLSREGDGNALDELYDRHASAMYGLALRVTGDASLAQDAVQDAFIGIWRNAASYASEKSSIRTWMMSITHHRAVDVVRRRRHLPVMPERVAAQPGPTAPDVWPEVSRGLDREALALVMAQLPASQREAISLAYFGGLTQLEIADRTRVPLGTVKSRIRLGLRQLRRSLDAPAQLADAMSLGAVNAEVSA